MTERLASGKLLLDSPAEAVVRIVISNPERRNALDHETRAGHPGLEKRRAKR